MDWEAIRKDLTTKLIGALAFAVIGWLAGTNLSAGMIRRVEENERKIEALSKVQEGRRAFINSAAARIEYLCNRDPECRDRFRPLDMPE